MKPYYEHAGITIYNCRWEDFLPSVTDKWYDLCFCDPPYGIGKADWDASYPTGFETEALRIAKCVAITPGMWALPQCISRLNGSFIGVIAARNMNGMTFSPLGFGNWIPTVIAGEAKKGTDAFDFTVNGDMQDHPSPKPFSYMRKLLLRLTHPEDLIMDLFIGSGTTLRAAKDIGRKAVGCEVEERYCEAAAKRLSQEVLEFQ